MYLDILIDKNQFYLSITFDIEFDLARNCR